MKRKSLARRGLSTIISSIIMCAVVIAIGGSLWSITQSVASVTGNTYYNSVLRSAYQIEERFCVENVGLNTSSNKLQVWVSNYGNVNITVQQILVKGGGNVSSKQLGVPLACGGIIGITLLKTDLSNIAIKSGLSISIEVVSSRGNEAYDTVHIP
jgi:archaellum component FlaF (FlaF/FlaG flagellin family)